MICKNCGTRFSSKDADANGYVFCPECGKKYRRLPRAAQAETVDNKPVRRAEARKAKRSSGSPLTAKLGGKVPVWLAGVAALALIAIVIVVIAVAGGSGSSGVKGIFQNADVGYIVKFGRYEQDNDPDNGKEPIEWVVLSNDEDGSTVLISRYILDSKPYDTTDADVTWETCELRKWLNEDFYAAAFSAEEKGLILSTKLVNSDDSYWDSEKGNDTIDKIYLLARYEIKEVYDKETADDLVLRNAPLQAELTEYVIAQEGYSAYHYENYNEYANPWWLRSNSVHNHSDVVTENGKTGEGWKDSLWGVRPVIRVQTTKSGTSSKSTSSTTINAKKLKEGSVISFGHYEQDADYYNGKEPIEWIVLSKNDDGSITLMSKYALDCKPYNSPRSGGNDLLWETCTLRVWLNDVFYDKAFNEKEKEMILITNNEDMRWLGSFGTRVYTDDKVFLLSIYEAVGKDESYDGYGYYAPDKGYSYLAEDESRICEGTKYAVAQGLAAYVYESDGFFGSYSISEEGTGGCDWWLRTIRYGQPYTIYYDGRLNWDGERCDAADIGVRPVIRIRPS